MLRLSPANMSSPDDTTIVGLTTHRLQIVTHDGLSAKRQWKQYISSRYAPGIPAPLLLEFHGQYGSATIGSGFTSNLNENGWIMVAPQGMGDGNCGTG